MGEASGPGHGAGTTLLEHRVTLGPAPTSAKAARMAVRDALVAGGHEEWIDTAELAVSELVTNAALHAHTEIDLLIEVYDDMVCVEVRDGDPTLPVLRRYGEEATTGRGLGLVAMLALDCGVHSLGDAGKITWFCVGEAPEPSVNDLLDAWDVDAEWAALDAATAGHTTVLLASMPATLWLAAREHHDALVRELVLYMAEHPEVVADVASADHARALVSTNLARLLAELGPLPTGAPVDLRVEVPEAQWASFAVLQDVLDLAEALAVGGELFTLPALPEVVAVRDWVCEQVLAQVAGVPALPWAGVALDRFETEAHGRVPAEPPSWNTTTVTESDRMVVAADQANRIVAVSDPLARLLGWRVEDLVGRRVVTLVPPALREAHVAGFTRHLSTGEVRVLGTPVELPVYCADGRELPCRLLIEQAPSESSQGVYLAWVEPLG